MKLSCEIVQDLLPLYQDEICSQQSREAVEQHLRNCACCSSQLSCKELPKPVLITPQREEQAVRNSFRKIKHRWWLSILAIAMILPLFGLSLMIRNEHRQEGICFSNLKELWNCYGYLEALEEGNGEKAASYIDFSSLYSEYRDAIEMKPEDHMAVMKEIRLNGETWVVQEGFMDATKEEIKEEEFWISILEGDRADVMIPIEVFHALAQDRGDLMLQGQGYRLDDGTWYLPYETESGVFMIHEHTWDLMKAGDGYLADYVCMMPKALYDQLEPLLWKRAEQWCRNTRDRLSDIIDLDETAFKEYMEKRYGDQLNELFQQGIHFRGGDYRSVYKGAGYWDADFTVYAELKGRGERVVIHFSCNNEGINRLYAMDTEIGQGFRDQLEFLSPRIP